MTPVRTSVLVAAFAFLVSSTAFPESTDDLLKAKQLQSSYNPVVLDFLLNEGKSALPEAQRKEAIDQLVTALKQDIVITPEEQKAASLLVAGAAMAELLGGSNSRELGSMTDDATWQIWNGWVDSAITLEKAGYRDEAIAFYQKCIDIYPYSDLKGRCAIALAGAKPDESVSRLMALTKDPDPQVAGRSLLLLGQLAGSDGFPAEKRTEIIKSITSFTSGMKKATYGEWACHGLVATGDAAVVPTLQSLSKGMMNADFYACSRRGLLLTFNDKSVVPLLSKTLQGGMMSTSKPGDKLSAAGLLIEAGEDAGYTWASQQLTAKKASTMKKFMATSSDDTFDFKPSTVSLLAGGKREKSLPVLTTGFDAAAAGSWIQTWIAIAMLELGDKSHIDLVKASMSVPEWDFTAVRAAEALARNGDYSGIGALGPVYDRALAGTESSAGAELLALVSGSGSEYSMDREAKLARLTRLRVQIADVLGEMNRADAVPLLEKMLADPAASVRVAAAHSLTSMTDKAAARGLAKAYDVDYGKSGSGSRNPVMQAAIVRAAGVRFPGDPATKTLLASAAKSSYPSVKFMALTLDKPAAKPASKPAKKK